MMINEQQDESQEIDLALPRALTIDKSFLSVRPIYFARRLYTTDLLKKQDRLEFPWLCAVLAIPMHIDNPTDFEVGYENLPENVPRLVQTYLGLVTASKKQSSIGLFCLFGVHAILNNRPHRRDACSRSN